MRLILVIGMILHFTVGFSQQEGTQKWVFQIGAQVTSSPAVGLDGTVYVGSEDNKLYAITPDGKQKWVFPTERFIFSSAAVGSDGTVYVGSEDNKLYAITPDGRRKWAFETEKDIRSSPAIGLDGTIYIGSWDSKLYAITPDGKRKWAFQTGNSVTSSPAIGSDGTVYVGSADNKLYAITPDGNEKWAFQIGKTTISSPAIGSDGTVYVGSADNKLYAITPDGNEKWALQTGGEIVSSPTIGADGTIYVGSNDYKVYAITPDGGLKWVFQTGRWVSSSPTVGSDGTIYVGSIDSKVYAITPEGKQRWVFQTEGGVWSSPTLDADGTLYIGSWDGKVYAIYSSSNDIANSSWPRFRQNNQGTGRPSSEQVEKKGQGQTASLITSTTVAKRSNVYALVIGISKYRDKRVPPLNADRDADKFAKVLEGVGGLESANIHTLINEDATASSITAEIKLLAGRMQPNDTLVFYFSGHGAPSDDGQPLLIPWDARPELLKDTSLRLSDLQGLFPSVGQVVMILDSCFSGESGSKSFAGVGAKPFGLQVKAPQATAQVAVLSSSATNESSYESERLGGSYFTYYLLEALSGAAIGSGSEITLDAAFSYVKTRVKDAVQQDRRVSQTPQFSAGSLGGFVLAYDPRKTLDARAEPLRKLASEGKITTDQYLALIKLIGSNEPSNLKRFLDGSLSPEDFKRLIDAGLVDPSVPRR